MAHQYKSKLEGSMGLLLETMGVPYSYEPHRLPYTKRHHYLPDFWVEKFGFYIETKGRFLPADRKKHKLIKEQHPEVDIRFAFSNPNQRLSKKSRTRYWEWCEKNDFLWCGKKVPREWFS